LGFGSNPSQAAPAATIVVDTEMDELDGSPGNSSCSLREVTTNANNGDGNQADCAKDSGGGIYLTMAEAVLTNSTVSGNGAYGSGG
jgi:hypothetical protein